MITKRSSQRGLVLLIVLGMLGLFSLLAVTYMVYSGNSRTSSVIINQAKLQDPGKVVYDHDIISLVLRGSRSNTSPIAMHSLLGDVYGRESIEGFVRNYGSTGNLLSFPIPQGPIVIGADLAAQLSSSTSFCKISLNQNIVFGYSGNGLLSPVDDTYTGRIFTMLEGPLAHNSFRILKYIGNETGASNDPAEFSILIDFAQVPSGLEIEGDVTGRGTFRGTLAQWLNPSAGPGVVSLFYNESGNPYRYLINDAVFNGVGYGLNPGSQNLASPPPEDLEPIGGNLTQYWTGSFANRLSNAMEQLTYPSSPKNASDFSIRQFIPVGLLPSYEYINKNNLLGSTNEGYDVADYRDYWLCNLNPNGDNLFDPLEVIPSYHRPELVQYIYERFATTGNLSDIDHVRQLIKLLDYACARPLPVRFVNEDTGALSHDLGIAPNDNFVADSIPQLIIDANDWPGADGVTRLNTFIQSLITGPFDVDNDGDGINESVWIDPEVPLVTGPDGKLLKVMAAISIQDMDGRINVNLAGDTTQAFETYTRPAENTDPQVRFYKTTTDRIFSQGQGVGPAELGLFHLLQNFDTTKSPNLLDARLQYLRQIFNARNGNDGNGSANFAWTGVPGRALDRNSNSGNDLVSSRFDFGLSERNHLWFGAGTAPVTGFPLSLRGREAFALDVFGNISIFRPQLDGPNGAFELNQLSDDGYELNQNGFAEDDMFTLEELERVLRRFDGDISTLSARLESILKRDTGWALAAEVNKVLTTRSNELRNLKIGYPGRDFKNDSDPRIQNMGSIFEWLAAIHEHHYRRTTGNLESVQSDPSMVKGTGATPPNITFPLTMRDATFRQSVVRSLFPIEFRKGLRMNLNRPFGNGFDNDAPFDLNNDRQRDSFVVDDPSELASASGLNERVPHPGLNPSPIGQFANVSFLVDPSDPYNEQPPLGNGAPPFGTQPYPYDGQLRYQSDPTLQTNETVPPQGSNISLQSRQLYARQLYCLAQLLVPQDYQFSTMADLTFGTTPQALRNWYKRRARTLAQWAINVADFRDSDAIMTRFDYDYLPFGIRQDGSTPHASGSTLGFTKDPGWEPEAGDVVWGMEYPELLLSETLAFHDKRVRVTTQHDQSGSDPLPTQFRKPEGSLFIELVNPRTFATADSQLVPAVPKELYTDVFENANGPDRATVALDLDRLAPAPAGASPFGQQPVWRIGVIDGKNESGTDINGYNNFDALINSQNANSNVRQPLTLTTDLLKQTHQLSAPNQVQFNGLISDVTDTVSPTNPPSNQEIFERIIWFTNQSPSDLNATSIPNLRNGNTNVNNKVFYNRRVDTANGSTQHPGGSYLPLGGYLAIAPREVTHIGSQVEESGNNTDQPTYSPSPQRIVATENFIEHHRIDDTLANISIIRRTAPINVANCVVQISQADPPVNPGNPWQGPNLSTFPLAPGEGIGLNISEPLPVTGRYYPRPDAQLSTAQDSRYEDRRPDAYQNLFAGEKLSTVILDDVATSNPILAAVPGQGTKPNFRTLYLQRLANPLEPYDPNWNPYITIDLMTVDLNVFTGENANQNYAAGGNNVTFAFESRFKDGRSMDGLREESGNTSPWPITPIVPNERNQVRSLFSASTAPLTATPTNATTPPAAPRGVYFSCELGVNTPTLPNSLSSTTLGYLNVGHTDGTNFDGFGIPTNNTQTPGFVGLPNPGNITLTGLYWANRDFANPMELMLVPFTAPGKLSTFFTTAFGVAGSNNNQLAVPLDNVYADSAGRLNAPFGHLLNFFDSNQLRFDPPPTFTNVPNAPNAVPRREPYWLSRTATTNTPRSDLSLLLELVETPPRYSDTFEMLSPLAMSPTVTGPDSHPSGDAEIDLIRQRMLFDYRSPYNTRATYTNPGKINVNTIQSEAVWNSIEWNTRTNDIGRSTVNDTSSWERVRDSRRGYALTTNPFNPNINPAVPSQFAGCWSDPFNINISPLNTPETRGQSPTTATWRRGDDAIPNRPTSNTSIFTNLALAGEQHATPTEQVASPFVTYQRMMRLSNLVTNQSNVFAVWITVGLFEYDPINGLGKEYIGPSGKPDRQRSFYIIDRTVPVAYREGENYNTEKAILLRRNIAR